MSTYSSIENKYSTGNISSSKDVSKEKEVLPIAIATSNTASCKKTSLQSSSKYGSSKSSSVSTEPKPTRYSSTSSLCTKSKLRDPSPIVEKRSTLDVPTRNRDPSPATTTTTGRRTRDPSPATTGRRLSVSSTRSQDIIPASSSLYMRSRSRDPSPCESYKGSRFTSSHTKNYNSGSSYTHTSLKSKKEPSIFTPNPLASRSTAGLSYLTASEASARISMRRAEREEKKKKSAESESELIPEKRSVLAVRSVTLDCETEETTNIAVVTRGTSPTPPNTTPANYVRPRRVDNAKTIEKTIQRSVKRPTCVDKEIQSDRLDDTSKYSRFKSSRIASWTSFLDNRPGTSHSAPASDITNNTLTQYGASAKPSTNTINNAKSSNLVKSDSTDSVKKIKPKTSSSLSSKSVSKCTTKSEKIKSESKAKSLTSTKSNSISSKQKSPENTRSLPPQAPKGDSPGKTIGSTGENPKWTNKDFRKSALNIGPTDRPRKSRASSESETENHLETLASIVTQHNERSPSSSSSEIGNVCVLTITDSEDSTKSVKVKSSPSLSLLQANKSSSKSAPQNELPPLKQNKSCDQSHIMCTNLDQSASSTSQKNISVAKSLSDGKSIFARAIGPVTNTLFKSKSQSSSSSQLQQVQQLQDTSYNDDNNSTSISESLELDTESVFLSTKYNVQSSENDNNFESSCHSSEQSNLKQQKMQPISQHFGTIATHKLRHIDSGDLSSWWCNDNDDDDEKNDTIASDITLNQTNLSESESTKSLNQISLNESEENAWRRSNKSLKDNSFLKNVMTREPSVSKLENREYRVDIDCKSNSTDSILNSKNVPIAPPPPYPPIYFIKHNESGEKEWWLNSDSIKSENENNNNHASNKSISSKSISEKISQWFGGQTPPKDAHSNSESSMPLRKYRIRHNESGEKAWWMHDDKTEELNLNDNENNDDDQKFIKRNDVDEPPLGDRASPEGLEDTSNKSRNSPYNNKDRVKNMKKLFVSRHTNIDDLLGGSCHPLSPLLLDYFESDEPFEKITPDQVRIHEGTEGRPNDIERQNKK